MKCNFCNKDATGKIELDFPYHKEYPICRTCGEIAIAALRTTQGAAVTISYPCQNVEAGKDEQ